MDPDRCFLLELPTELRLLIYDYCLFPLDAVTIGSRKIRAARGLAGSGCESDEDEDGDGDDNNEKKDSKSSIVGLLDGQKPVIKPYYDPLLLSGTPSAVSPASEQEADDDSAAPLLPITTPFALLQTCRSINDELAAHLSTTSTTNRVVGPAIYLTYPYGVLAFEQLCPQLLRLARSVHVSGVFDPSRPGAMGPGFGLKNRTPIFINPATVTSGWAAGHAGASAGYTSATTTSGTANDATSSHTHATTTAATTSLGALVRAIFSPVPHPTVAKLEMRIYYPDEARSGRVWGDDRSPVGVAISNTCGGLMDCALWRGNKGTGVELTVRHQPESRYFVQVWRRSKEEGGGEGFFGGEGWGG